MSGDYAALLGPSGVASHAMGKEKRPTNHNAANLPSAGKKKDVKPYKQYNIKNQDMDSTQVPDVNQEKDEGVPHHQEGVGLGWAGGPMQEQALGCGLPSLPHHEAERPDCPVPRLSGLSTATRPNRSAGGRKIPSSCV